MWDQRYGQPEYFFGREPADFLRRESKHLRAGGRVLCIADGEGRNSVYLAKLGYDVTAFDPSPVGIEKARRLAEQKQVTPDFHLSGVETWDWAQTYDAVVAIFIQFAAPELRERMFRWMAQAIVPGGVLLLHGYAPRQVDYGTGGPPNVSHMYTEDILRDAFEDFEILRLTDYDAEIHEGPGHSGKSALLDLIARKPI